MKEILKLNSISPVAKAALGENYNITDNAQKPEAVLVRSFAMQDWNVPDSLLCVARAGAGVNNIPFDDYAKRGIVVFNTPGANANAVKELVISLLIMAARNLYDGAVWAQGLQGDDVKKQVEKGKSQFAGTEILGKTLGILGLGAIGRKVAASANALGMKIVGYDPFVSEAAKALDYVEIVDYMDEVFAKADFLTIHIPYSKDTHNFINADAIAKMKNGVIIVNAARGELVCANDIKTAVSSGKVKCYATDFPDADVLNFKGILTTPHLGASSEEAEDNCAEMAALEIKAFLENGEIKNSVNMPALSLKKGLKHRAAAVFTGDKVQTTAKVTNKFGISYGLIESENEIDLETLSATEGVIKARLVY